MTALRWPRVVGPLFAAVWLAGGDGLAQPKREPGMVGVIIEVELSCPSCAQGLQRRLGRLDHVVQVEVRVADGQVSVTPGPGRSVDLGAVRDVVLNAGFVPTGLVVTAVGRLAQREEGPALVLSDDAAITLAKSAQTDTLLVEAGTSIVQVTGHVRSSALGDRDVLEVEAFEIWP
jgi:hypothetical protein